jgi:4-carboxymuconolactone decarboxylase
MKNTSFTPLLFASDFLIITQIAISAEKRHKEVRNMENRKLPKWFADLKDKHTEYVDALEQLGKTVRSAGPLDEKTAQLIQLAAAAAIRSEGAVHSHARRAVQAGASVEEVYHAVILLTSTIGFPNVSAAMSWIGDEI